ncbi:MAG: hypothetical protein HC821_01045 [Lewinella sp.]|nr:hypothetical protein [Lewinella sp.]
MEVGSTLRVSNIQGGLAPYTILVDDELQSGTIVAGISPGSHRLEIRDAANCSLLDSFVVFQQLLSRAKPKRSAFSWVKAQHWG